MSDRYIDTKLEMSIHSDRWYTQLTRYKIVQGIKSKKELNVKVINVPKYKMEVSTNVFFLKYKLINVTNYPMLQST